MSTRDDVIPVARSVRGGQEERPSIEEMLRQVLPRDKQLEYVRSVEDPDLAT